MKNEKPIADKSRSKYFQRALWKILWLILIRPFPRRMALKWEIIILRLFGAKIHSSAQIYSSTKIWLPCNLIMEENSILGDYVEVYNVDIVHLKKDACVSQYTKIYPGSHNFSSEGFENVSSPIVIEEEAWVAANSFLGYGCSVGRGAIIGAASVVRNIIPPYAMIIGNPAKIVGFKLTPDEIVNHEVDLYQENERLPKDKLEKNYEKFFLKRIKEIKIYSKL